MEDRHYEPTGLRSEPLAPAGGPRGGALPRSVSMPRSLPSTGTVPGGKAATAAAAAALAGGPAYGGPGYGAGRKYNMLRVAPIKSGLRMLSESRSLPGRRGGTGQAVSDLCEDLHINDGAVDDAALAARLRAATLAGGAAQPRSEAAPLIDRGGAAQRALANPDILFLVLEQLDALNIVPHELTQRRRKPLSLRHAQLIYGETPKAIEEWERANAQCSTTAAAGPGAGLYQCLQVNSCWYGVTRRVLETRVFLKDGSRWRNLVSTAAAVPPLRKPRMLVVHKLNDAKQIEVDKIAPSLGGTLAWLEFYTCAGLVPTAELLAGGMLTKIVLPGCSRVTDRTMSLIAEHCPALEYLDLRACEQVSDKGLKMIAKYCPELALINVGRIRNGELVSYKGIKHLARQTKLNTLGVAGCHIDDRAIWELALNRGSHLQRLSLNNCRLLTDASVPRILPYCPKLSVLEIRGCIQITEMRSLALFKRYREQLGHPPLIEGCEVIERRLKQATERLKQDISRRIIADCQEWVNLPDSDLQVTPLPAQA